MFHEVCGESTTTDSKTHCCWLFNAVTSLFISRLVEAFGEVLYKPTRLISEHPGMHVDWSASRFRPSVGAPFRRHEDNHGIPTLR